MANIPLESVKPIENKEQEIVKFKENTLSQSTNNKGLTPILLCQFPSDYCKYTENMLSLHQTSNHLCVTV